MKKIKALIKKLFDRFRKTPKHPWGDKVISGSDCCPKYSINELYGKQITKMYLMKYWQVPETMKEDAPDGELTILGYDSDGCAIYGYKWTIINS